MVTAEDIGDDLTTEGVQHTIGKPCPRTPREAVIFTPQPLKHAMKVAHFLRWADHEMGSRSIRIEDTAKCIGREPESSFGNGSPVIGDDIGLQDLKGVP
jgi:hypothetical protein